MKDCEPILITIWYLQQSRFYVLRKSSQLSILVATGYLTGREDLNLANIPQLTKISGSGDIACAIL